MFSDLLKKSLFSLMFVGLMGVSESQAANLTAGQIYSVAAKGTPRALEALKQIGAGQLEVTDGRGNTAMCLSVLNDDYKAFNLLKRVGANLRAPCVRQFSREELREFNRGYADWVRTMKPKTATFGSSSGETSGLSAGTIVGAGVGVAAVAGGIALLASHGGGGGHSSSGSGGTSKGWENTIPLDSQNPEDYRTEEFEKGKFLSQIGAEYAYARGVGGYTINDDGSKGDPVRVGVLDNGVDITHPDLVGSLAKNSSGKTYGYNFDYGPCRKGDTTHCYGVKTIDEKGYFVFYDSGKDDYKILIDGEVTQDQVDKLFESYPSNYDWDKLKNDPAPHLIGDAAKVKSDTNTASTDHGTHVSGIIGANMNNKGMQGVAPYVSIVPGIYDPLNIGFGFEEAMKTYAKENVRVINTSFGVKSSTGNQPAPASVVEGHAASDIYTDSQIEAYKTAAKNNIVIVKSAGNDGNDYMPYYDAGVPLTTTFGSGSKYDLSKLFITVVSVGQNNDLASYSQVCGATQGYCLAAPGGDSYWGIGPNEKKILSTVQNDSKHSKNEDGAAYGYMEGTSMAAPVVTGSVALLMGEYPHLTSQQVVEILFRTANKDLNGWTNDGVWTYKTKDGETHHLWTSSIYGHGMVDLDAATKPLGNLEIPTGSSTSSHVKDLAATNFVFPKNVLWKNDLMDRKVMVLDDYDRGYAVPIRSMVKKTHRNPDGFKHSFKSFFAKRQQVTGLDDKMTFSFSNTSVTDDSLLGTGALDVRWKLSDRNAVTFSYRSDILAEKHKTEQALANPFLDMRESYAVTHTFDMSKRVSFAVSAVTGKNGFFEGDQDRHEEFNKSTQAFASEVVYRPADKVALRLSGGVLRESDAVLGMTGAGAFDTGNSQTYFTGAAVEYTPVEPLKLTAAYYYGRSEMPKTGSLVNFSQVVSDSFALDAQYRLNEKDLFGLQFTSPLRVRKGSARFDLPVARDMYTDTVYRDQAEVSLKPDAREYDLGFYYMHETGDYDWRGELMARFNPDHMADARPDYRAMVGMSIKY